MTDDLLLEISKNRRARSLVSAIGLPLPMPEPLARVDAGWRDDELLGLDVVISPLGPME